MLYAQPVLDTLSNLTRLRDHDALEVALGAALSGLLQPRCLRFWRVEEQHGKLWLALALLFDDEAMLHVPRSEMETEALQPLTHWPAAWQDACLSGAWRCYPDEEENVLVLPLRVERASTRLLVEIRQLSPIDADLPPLLQSLLVVFANHLRLLDYAEKDTLTGPLNRKTFETAFSKLLLLESMTDSKNQRFHQRQRHHDSSPWLAVVDIDHFKQINDRFGHLYGDEVLILFAGILKRTVRSQDVVYRFGGEEFVVVLAPLTAAAACQVFERLRESIAGYDFPQIGTVTASLGYTRIRPHVDATTVIGEADQALYYAKEHGRNRICRFESIAAQLPAANATRHSDAELF